MASGNSRLRKPILLHRGRKDAATGRILKGFGPVTAARRKSKLRRGKFV